MREKDRAADAARKLRLLQVRKRCLACDQAKPLADFPRNTYNPLMEHHFRSVVCWDCINADPEGRAALQRERSRDRWRSMEMHPDERVRLKLKEEHVLRQARAAWASVAKQCGYTPEEWTALTAEERDVAVKRRWPLPPAPWEVQA